MNRFNLAIILALIFSVCSLFMTVCLMILNIVTIVHVQMNFSDILLFAETIVLAATLIAVGYQIAVQRRELRESTKNRQGSFMFEVFKGLSTEEARKDRSFIFGNSLPGPDKTLSDPAWKTMNNVWTQLNQLGLYIEKGLIEEDLVMELYWDVILKCWNKLEGHLKVQRDKRHNNMYQKYFEILAKRAEKYRKEHYPNEDIKYYNEASGFFL
jgi:hypothetical protein